jgi:hypothetical protein
MILPRGVVGRAASSALPMVPACCHLERAGPATPLKAVKQGAILVVFDWMPFPRRPTAGSCAARVRDRGRGRVR